MFDKLMLIQKNRKQYNYKVSSLLSLPWALFLLTFLKILLKSFALLYSVLWWGGNMRRRSTSCLRAFGWRWLRANGKSEHVICYNHSGLRAHHFISLFMCFIINLRNSLMSLKKLLILLIWLKSKEWNQIPNKK